ncbi:hypothetical protein HP456_09655 [Bacillus haikouensis]|uniref:hypothetical protein n=1 Tax=Bacillus haikouensis TaxID=1510468 RepID=UPI0015569684|nr:hypothetical protein [Bacillus haikouensis]NQD66180.1 hypothetical protein [Bacillus haikouensis]
MINQWYNIGAFTFPGSWAAIAAALLTTFLFLFFWNRKAGDWYSNAIFIFILTWKLSVIVVDFATVIKHPITILYFHGGTAGYWMGIAGILVYTFIKSANRYHVLTAWVMTVLVYEGMFDLMNGTYIIGTVQLIFNGVLLLLLLNKLGTNGKNVWSIQLLTIFTLNQFLMNSFGGFQMDTTILTYIILAIVLLFLLIKEERASFLNTAGRKTQ